MSEYLHLGESGVSLLPGRPMVDQDCLPEIKKKGS